MKKTPITVDPDTYPREFATFFEGARVFDSSCSPEARVIFIDKDGGYYLKCAPRGALCKEAELGSYFHSKGLGAKVLGYVSNDRDFLLTARAAGEDLTHSTYLDDPKRLSETLALLLRELHSTPSGDCPVRDRISTYLETARQNRALGRYDLSLFGDSLPFRDAEEAWQIVEGQGHLLENECLIHGDYCLPNVIFDSWSFSSFIDLGNGGAGDRHIDLFWGAWTLCYNLHTDKYTDRFFDAYGREAIESDRLRIVAAAEIFG